MINTNPNHVTLPEDRKLHDLAMLHRVMRTDAASHHRWRRRGALIGIGSLVLAGGGVATAAALLSPQKSTDTISARCYSSASSDFGSDFPGTSVASASDGNTQSGTIADSVVEDCAAAWRLGVLVMGNPTAQRGDDSANNPVPHLVACVLPSGEAAVFPGPDGTCQKLSLPALKIAGR